MLEASIWIRLEFKDKPLQLDRHLSTCIDMLAKLQPKLKKSVDRAVKNAYINRIFKDISTRQHISNTERLWVIDFLKSVL